MDNEENLVCLGYIRDELLPYVEILGYIGDEILPSYVGILGYSKGMKFYPAMWGLLSSLMKPTSIQWKVSEFFFAVAQLSLHQEIVNKQLGSRDCTLNEQAVFFLVSAFVVRRWCLSTRHLGPFEPKSLLWPQRRLSTVLEPTEGGWVLDVSVHYVKTNENQFFLQ